MLEIGLGVWNDKLAELWTLITQSPENFKGSDVWNVIVNINSAVQGFGYGLLVLFFAMGVFQSAAGFRELQRPEFALRHFIRFALANDGDIQDMQRYRTVHHERYRRHGIHDGNSAHGHRNRR